MRHTDVFHYTQLITETVAEFIPIIFGLAMIMMVYSIHGMNDYEDSGSESETENDSMLASLINDLDDIYNRSLMIDKTEHDNSKELSPNSLFMPKSQMNSGLKKLNTK